MQLDAKKLIKLSPIVLLVIAGAMLAWHHWNSDPTVVPVAPQAKSEFAGSQSCQACHPDQFDAWKNSHHGLAEVEFSPSEHGAAFRVSGDGNTPDGNALQPNSERVVTHGNFSSTFRERNGKFEVLTQASNGATTPFEPVRIIGLDPLWQNVIAAPRGRYQVTALAYHPKSDEWFDANSSQAWQPHEWGHWTGRGMTWNSMCATCHTTDFQKNYNFEIDSYNSQWIELGVGCESCHGPSSLHVDEMKREGKTAADVPALPNLWDPAKFLSTGPPLDASSNELFEGITDSESDGQVAAPPKILRSRVADTCGMCHARRADLTGNFRAGERFLDHYRLDIPNETNVFYPDGQIWDEDYEYASFVSSRMYVVGVRCVHCHDPHTGKTRAQGNDLCLNCHKDKIDPATHSHHPVGSTGFECTGCHMPTTVYMERHPRHDHGFTIPDPTLTKDFDIPNACNRCHQDESVDWAIARVDEWYGDRMNRPTRTRARALARAKAGDANAIPDIIAVGRDDPNPYWRAVAAGFLNRWAATDQRVLEFLMSIMSSPSALVRATATRSLSPRIADAVALSQSGRGGPIDHALLEKSVALLEDPIRLPRVEAAWAMRFATHPDQQANARRFFIDDDKVRAGQELKRYLELATDQPSGLAQLGQMYFDRGDAKRALELFQRACEWSPTSASHHDACAVAHSALGDMDSAVRSLEKAHELAPADAWIAYRLGLALAEADRLPEAAAKLRRAVEIDGGFSRAWYNLAQALWKNEDLEEALEAISQAENLEPSNPDFLSTRASLHKALKQFTLAEEYEARAQQAYSERDRRR